MESLKRWHVAVLSACLGAAIGYVGVDGGVAAEQETAQRWPPQFPREGATKLFENDHVIVWEQIGRPNEPFAHKHLRDVIHFAVEPGRVEVFGPGMEQLSSGGPSYTEGIYSRGANSLSYARAGLGPHVEMAPDPDNLPISIFVEIKGTEPADCAEWSTACD